MKPKFKVSDLVKVVTHPVSGQLPLTESFLEYSKEKWEPYIGTLCIIMKISDNKDTKLPTETDFQYSVKSLGPLPYVAWLDEYVFELVRRHEELNETT